MKRYFLKHITSFLFLLFLVVFSCPVNSDSCFSTEEKIVKFVQVTDIHLDKREKPASSRMYHRSYELFEDAVKQINAMDDLDFVVFTGDLVNEPSQERFEDFGEIANRLKVPWYFTTGNHDVSVKKDFDKPDFLEIISKTNERLDFDNTYYSFVLKDNYLFIFMDGAIDKKDTSAGYFSREQLKWLENLLETNYDKVAVIFQHFPVVEPFRSNSHRVLNAGSYQKILEKYYNVLAVISGHYHSTKINRTDNTIHVSTPALVQYPNAFRVFKIRETEEFLELDISLMETALKNIQMESKNKTKSIKLAEGKEKDKSLKIYLYKSIE